MVQESFKLFIKPQLWGCFKNFAVINVGVSNVKNKVAKKGQKSLQLIIVNKFLRLEVIGVASANEESFIKGINEFVKRKYFPVYSMSVDILKVSCVHLL